MTDVTATAAHAAPTPMTWTTDAAWEPLGGELPETLERVGWWAEISGSDSMT